MPVYQLLGGASRNGLHGLRPRVRQGAARAVRLDPRAPGAGLPGDPGADRRARARRRSTASRRRPPTRVTATPLRPRARPARRASRSRRTGTPAPTCATCRACSRPCATSSAPTSPLLHDGHHRMTPIQAAQLGKALEPYDLFWLEDCTPAENQEALRLVRQHTTTPLAIGEIFNTIWDFQDLIRDQLIDYVRGAVTHTGGITAAEEDPRLRGDVPDQVGHARADRHLTGRHGRRDAPRARHPQLRHPGVHAARRQDRRGVPAVVHLDRRLPAPGRAARASASS